jgi:hypothetical protein
MQLTRLKVMLKKVSISFLLGLMVLSSFSFYSPTPVSAATVNSLPTPVTVVSGDNKVVTVSFSVYAAQTDTYDDFKDAITVKGTGDTEYSALALNDTVAFSNTVTEPSATLVVTFDNALTGNEISIRIAPDALTDIDNVNFEQIDLYFDIHDIIPPAYIGSTSNKGNEVYLKFDEYLIIDSGEESTSDFLRSRMSIATDGVNFAPLSEEGEVYHYNSNEIYINYNYDMKVILGRNTVVKIASGTFKDESDNFNEEMIFDISPPFIESADISSDYHDVTISFHEDVYDNTLDNGTVSNLLDNTLDNGTVSYLKDYIEIIRTGSVNDESLEEGDTVSIVSGNLFIHFAKALTGVDNQITINDRALKDISGNVLSDDISTPYIVANVGVPIPVDTEAPELRSVIYYGNDITLVFNEEIQNNKDSIETFISSITFPYDQYGPYYSNYRFPSTPTVTFSGKLLNFHFDSPLTGEKYFSISADSIKDTANNVIGYNIDRYEYPRQGLIMNNASFLNNGKSMILDFNYNLMDNTKDIEGISHLKEKIKISTDHGANFLGLDEQDILITLEDKLYILFNEPKKMGIVTVKVEADALRDQYGVLSSPVINQVVAYNTPDLTGYFFSNVESEFLFEDNDEWRSKVKEVILYDDYSDTLRPLNSSEYTLTAGKITINSVGFREGRYYELYINAEGYSTKYVEGNALKSSEIFYMTAPTITKVNGITASINVLNADLYSRNNSNATTGTQTVVFQLMNGTTPVSIVTVNLKVGTGKYSAHFNVADAATNSEYSVSAYIVSRFDTDGTSVGTNLATQVTQKELDLKEIQLGNNNNNNGFGNYDLR